jgi:hypothetical protein
MGHLVTLLPPLRSKARLKARGQLDELIAAEAKEGDPKP